MFRFLFNAPILCLLATASFAADRTPLSATRGRAATALNALPAWFEQTAGGFQSRNAIGTLAIASSEATYFTGPDRLHMRLLSSNSLAVLSGQKQLQSRSAYFLGNQKADWRGDVPQYSAVRASSVYPGIDVVYHFSGKALEFDFAVAPGADPDRIRLTFEGAGTPRLDPDGNLAFPNGIIQMRPVAYQHIDGERQTVVASYRIQSDGTVKIQMPSYDRSKPLIVDPVLFSTFVGGDRNEVANAVAIDKNGTVWVTGASSSYYGLSIPTTAIQNSTNGGRDVFVAGFTPDANGLLRLVYWTQLGGSQDDEATAIAVDDQGFVYVAGRTASNLDFPRGGGALQTDFGGATDSFITILRPELGSEALQYSQWYGGNNDDVVTAIAVDGTGAVYLAGNTRSDALNGATGVQSTNRGGAEGFFIKVVPASSSPLSYSTYFGGAGSDFVTGIALGSNGVVWLGGHTDSSDFPITGDDVFQPRMNSNLELFLVRINIDKAGLNGLEYCTYIGGDGQDVSTSMRMDPAGQLWLTGYTFSTNLPGVNSRPRGDSDAFVLRFDPTKAFSSTAVTYGTLIGGAATDVIYGMTFLSGDRVALAGYTFSTDFPVIGESRARPGSAGAHAFLVQLNPALGPDAITYSNVVSGSLADIGTAIASDSRGFLYLAGYTFSRDFPVTNGSVKQSSGGQSQSFLLSTRTTN